MCTNIEEICRTCMNKKLNLISIYASTSNIPSICKAIMECAPVMISETDDLPHGICGDCVAKLEVAYGFRILCINSDFNLRNKVAEIKDEQDEKPFFPADGQDELNPGLDVPEVKSEGEEIADYLEVGIDTEDVSDINDAATEEQSTNKPVKKGKNKKKATNKKDTKNKKDSTKKKTKKRSPSKQSPRKQGPEKCPMEKGEDGLYHCEICPRKYKYRGELETHLTKHTDFRYRCEKCDKQFITIRYLKRHMVSHTEEPKKYSCEFCGLTFRWNSVLEEHRRIHLNLRPYPCEVCDKSFRLRKVLLNHMRTHTGERPFACDICGKSFNRRHHLSNHKQIHGEKRFKCHICLQGFTTKQSLNQHLLNH